MKISHVIRGEEWLPSAPLHVLLYEAFGWADTAPWSSCTSAATQTRRQGQTQQTRRRPPRFPRIPLEWHDPKSGETSRGYRESGYLPQAVVNFLALLGWNPGDDTEVMGIDELIAKFSFDHCSRSGAKFAFDKGKWFNHTYLQNIPDAELAELFKPVLKAHEIDLAAFSDSYIAAAAGMVKSRINFVSDLWDNARFFFAAPTEYDPKAVKNVGAPKCRQSCDSFGGTSCG